MSIPTRIARLNSNGTTDTGFDPGSGLNASGHCICQLQDGRYLVGGSFTQMDGSPKNRLAVVKADGLVDPAALPANGDVRVIQKQADGKIIIGGGFTTLAATVRNRLARLKADLTLDPAFAPSFSGPVRALALQEDGKAVVGGFFSTVTGSTRNNIARLFNDPASQSLAVVSTSRVIWLRGGSIPETERVTFEIDTGGGYGDLGGTVARIPGGWEVSGLSLSGDGTIRARAFPGDGHAQSCDEATAAFDFSPVIRVSIGGTTLASGADVDFGDIQNGGTNDLTVLLTNIGLSNLTVTGGTPVTKSGTNADQWTIVSQPASPIAPGGNASFILRFNPSSVGAKVAVLSIASDDAGSPFTLDLTGEGMPGPGSRDTAFQASFSPLDATVRAVSAGAMVFVGGQFTTLNGVNRKNFARVSLGGIVQPQTGAGTNVTGLYAAAQLPNGKWMIGGDFTSVNGVARARLARLNADGTLDTSFNIAVNGTVHAIAVQEDGSVFVGGRFDTVGGQNRAFFAQLTPSGTLSASWQLGLYQEEHVGIAGVVHAIAIMPDGRVVIGGRFRGVGSVDRPCLARFNSNGSFDASFNASLSYFWEVAALTVDYAGRVLMSHNGAVKLLSTDGATTVATVSQVGTTIAIQADGKILIGTANSGVIRTSSEGVTDTAFTSVISSGAIASMTISPDGGVIVGGTNMMVDGQGFALLRLINGPELASSALSVLSPTAVQWQQSGTAPAAQYAIFELSQDSGATWASLGRGSRVSGAWQLNGIQLPAMGMLRARGNVSDGGGSSAFHDAVISFSGLAVPDIKVQYPLGTEIPDDGSLRFDGQLPGQSITLALKIENTGFGTLTGLTAASSTSTFTVTSLDQTTLAPGQIATALVRFTAVGVQDHTAVLTFTSNVPGVKSSYQITMRGRGVAAPVVATTTAANLASTAARLRGTVKPNHDETKVFFQYKRTNTSTWIQAPVSPYTGTGFVTQELTHDISGLTPASAYHYRIVAFNSVRNSADPVYGATVGFSTPA